MARKIDITDKLDFDGKPIIQIQGEEIAVNDDAETVLKIMGIYGRGDPGPAEIAEIYSLIIDEQGREKLKELGVNFLGLQQVINTAVGLITGSGDESAGE